MSLKLSPESIILSAICIADMLITVFLVKHGMAMEQNPLMASCIRQSYTTFIIVKLLSFLPFVAVTEWYRKYNPEFARTAARIAIVAYTISYAVLTIGTNMA